MTVLCVSTLLGASPSSGCEELVAQRGGRRRALPQKTLTSAAVSIGTAPDLRTTTSQKRAVVRI